MSPVDRLDLWAVLPCTLIGCALAYLVLTSYYHQALQHAFRWEDGHEMVRQYRLLLLCIALLAVALISQQPPILLLICPILVLVSIGIFRRRVSIVPPRAQRRPDFTGVPVLWTAVLYLLVAAALAFFVVGTAVARLHPFG